MDGDILAQEFFDVPGDIGVRHERRQPDLQLDPAAEKQRQKLGGKSGDRVLSGGTQGLLETRQHTLVSSPLQDCHLPAPQVGVFSNPAALTFSPDFGASLDSLIQPPSRSG